MAKIITTSGMVKQFFAFYQAHVLGLDAPENQYYIYQICIMILKQKGIKDILTTEQIESYKKKLDFSSWAYYYCLNIRSAMKEIKNNDKEAQKKLKHLENSLMIFSYKYCDLLNDNLLGTYNDLIELTDLDNVGPKDFNILKARLGMLKMGDQNNRGEGY